MKKKKNLSLELKSLDVHDPYSYERNYLIISYLVPWVKIVHSINKWNENWGLVWKNFDIVLA